MSENLCMKHKNFRTKHCDHKRESEFSIGMCTPNIDDSTDCSVCVHVDSVIFLIFFLLLLSLSFFWFVFLFFVCK